MAISFSEFANTVKPEGAFEVLAVAKKLSAAGKKVYELEIGDSPFPSPPAARDAGINAIQNDLCHYGPSAGVNAFREAASVYINREFKLNTSLKNIIAGPGAKTFQLLFTETFLDPGDGVLVFSPYFPTYPANIHRRGARMVTSELLEAHEFRPSVADVENFLETDPAPKAIFVNSPHNPTGGIAHKEDLTAIANIVRGTNIAIFSDEPYDQMAWRHPHHSIYAEPGMADHVVAAYTFSKSFSMSGWRLGFAVANEKTIDMFDALTNTVISCVPPFIQMAGVSALQHALTERDHMMGSFQKKLESMVSALNTIEGVHCLLPGGSFYAFPNVKAICNKLQITSHGLAMYLLEAADAETGVACLGGECFGEAGAGFIRLSSALPEEELINAIAFMAGAFDRQTHLTEYIIEHPEFKLTATY
ncbi:MAG: pyridoxal phosphate-dependent aminotransferase [Pseudomonadota bacterium]